MTEQTLKARREYQKQWRKKNPDKVKATQERFYQKKAQEFERENGEKP